MEGDHICLPALVTHLRGQKVVGKGLGRLSGLVVTVKSVIFLVWIRLVSLGFLL